MDTKIHKIKFHTPYGNQPPRCIFNTSGESLTQQQFAEESEINNIIRSHDRNGIIEHINRGNAIYGDFSNITDLSDALEQIKDAQEEFLSIPSDIREKFQNDAGSFFKFASNPDNIDELRTMGLAEPQRLEAMPSNKASSPVEPQNSEGEDAPRITT